MTLEEELEIAKAAAQEEGRKEGLQEGLRDGRKEGLRDGRKEGLRKGRKEGLRDGRKEGLRDGRVEGRSDMAAENAALVEALRNSGRLDELADVLVDENLHETLLREFHIIE